MVGDYVRISKYKNVLAEGYTADWSEDVFVIAKVKKTVIWTYVIHDLNVEETIVIIYEKELQKTNQLNFWIEKVMNVKVISSMLNGKVMIVHLIVGFISLIYYNNESMFS